MTSEPTKPQQDADAQNTTEKSGNLRPADAPVLGPRPVYRPDVDPGARQAFARPKGVEGAFSPAGKRAEASPELNVRPPDPILAEAFGRPADASDSIQRDPSAGADAVAEEEPGDPWRDPHAQVRLGSPAVTKEQQAPLPPAEKLAVREVLFGHRVAPRALAILAGTALLIGLVGGLVGRLTAEVAGDLTSKKVSLQQSGAGADEPQGQVAKVADAVLPAEVGS